MEMLRRLLPVAAIAVVLVTMAIVDVFIIGEPLRIISTVPMLLVLVLWGAATIRTRSASNAR
ncbi:MAG: hypothetical protein ACTSVT_00075 [Candidatus Thorarchaeota archaeon]